MLPLSFDYEAPKSVQEAIQLLRTRGEGAKVIAGGQSLIPLLKLRLASPAVLVDINRIEGLDYIRESAGRLRIGALTRMAEIETSDLVRKKYPIIHDASEVIGDPLVRNLGTIGGNICHGDPTNDMPAVMLALEAEFNAAGPSSERTIRAEDFFLDTFTVAVKHEEILTEVRVPAPSARSGGAYLKHEQKVADFATAGAAVQLSVDSMGQFEKVGIGLTAVGPTAIKAKEAEDALKWRRTTDREAKKTAVRLAVERSEPSTDARGTADYKRRLVEKLLVRALEIAHRRVRSGGSG